MKNVVRSVSYLILMSFAILWGNSTASGAEPKPKSRPYAFVISGGVSLGAYEAGINWSTIKAMKLMRDNQEVREWIESDANSELMTLKAVSGASAGGINSLITAISWCGNHKLQDDVEDNLFKNTWVDVGLDDLFPENSKGSKFYSDDDGLFTRRKLDKKLEDIGSVLKSPDKFQPSCKVPIGLVITRTHAKTFEFQNNQIKVPNQRFVVPIELEIQGDGKGARFLNYPLHSDDNIIYLQQNSIGNAISNANVFALVKATSAFPVAFGPQDIHYCLEEQGARGNTYCPDNYRREADQFVDGGVFDNIPLGVAIDLMTKKTPGPEKTRKKKKAQSKQYYYFYIDPDKRRGPAINADEDSASTLRIKGLLKNLSFLTDSYGTARKYELYKTLKALEKSKVDTPDISHILKLSDRYPPITGSYLMAFGAFFDKSFRLYDYYAGVYDGIYFLARQQCNIKDEACIAEKMSRWAGELGLYDEHHELAASLFSYFASWELPGFNPAGNDINNDKKHDDIEQGDDIQHLIRFVGTSIRQDSTNKEPKFSEFVNRLKSTSIDKKKDSLSASLKTLLYNNNWKSIYLNRASRRLMAMENVGKGKSDIEYIKPLAALIDVYTLKRIKNNEQGFVCRPSFDGKGCWAMPYEISININGRGTAISHEYRYKGDALIMNLRPTLYGYEGIKENRINYSQLDLLFEFEPLNNLIEKSFIISSLGAGISTTYGHNDADEGFYYGLSMYLGIIGDTLRLTYGVRDNSELNHVLGGNDYVNRDDHYLYLGISDIPGLMRLIINAM